VVYKATSGKKKETAVVEFEKRAKIARSAFDRPPLPDKNSMGKEEGTTR